MEGKKVVIYQYQHIFFNNKSHIPDFYFKMLVKCKFAVMNAQQRCLKLVFLTVVYQTISSYPTFSLKRKKVRFFLLPCFSRLNLFNGGRNEMRLGAYSQRYVQNCKNYILITNNLSSRHFDLQCNVNTLLSHQYGKVINSAGSANTQYIAQVTYK